jgi:cysteine synthase A
MSILDAIGNTSLVPLRRVVPEGCARILVKLEGENPTGSMKDRMARAVIERAEADGRLKPGGTVVEYTGGSTGTSLALVCAAKGYRIRIVTSEAFSQEKRDHMAALGAELTLVPAEGGLTTKKLILDMVETARALAREPGSFWTNQLENADSIEGYHALGEEIWDGTGGRVDAFVHCVGTSASSRGVATVLGNATRRSGSGRSSPASRRSSPAARRARTRSRASGSATCPRCGSRRSTTRSWRSRRPTRRRWRAGSRGRKRCSRARRPART